jgi:hypothetical protein
MEARKRESMSRTSLVIQSFTARQTAAPMDSLTATCPPVSGLQMANAVPITSSDWRAMVPGSAAGRPLLGRQSARQEMGAPGG